MAEYHLRHYGVFAGVVLAGFGLAGCSSSLLPSMPSSVSSMFGSGTPAGNANASTTGMAALPPDVECPDVTVRQGASTLTSSADPAEPSATNLRYQVTIGTTARECRLQDGNMVAIKVGMEGRVILGPEGSAGNIDVPLRFAVVQEGIDPKVIVTKLDRVAVTVPPDSTNLLFTHVTEGLLFPMPKGNALDSYIVYIGFDPLSVQEQQKKKPAPKAARKRKP